MFLKNTIFQLLTLSCFGTVVFVSSRAIEVSSASSSQVAQELAAEGNPQETKVEVYLTTLNGTKITCEIVNFNLDLANKHITIKFRSSYGEEIVMLLEPGKVALCKSPSNFLNIDYKLAFGESDIVPDFVVDTKNQEVNIIANVLVLKTSKKDSFDDLLKFDKRKLYYILELINSFAINCLDAIKPEETEAVFKAIAEKKGFLKDEGLPVEYSYEDIILKNRQIFLENMVDTFPQFGTIKCMTKEDRISTISSALEIFRLVFISDENQFKEKIDKISQLEDSKRIESIIDYLTKNRKLLQDDLLSFLHTPSAAS